MISNNVYHVLNSKTSFQCHLSSTLLKCICTAPMRRQKYFRFIIFKIKYLLTKKIKARGHRLGNRTLTVCFPVSFFSECLFVPLVLGLGQTVWLKTPYISCTPPKRPIYMQQLHYCLISHLL
jgi:hypothetical protein